MVSKAVRMTWVYVIRFADKAVPEKQEIEIVFDSDPPQNIVEEDSARAVLHGPSRGEIELSIRHTARSWGTDIESLLTNHFQSLLIQLIVNNTFWIGFVTFLILLVSAWLGIYIMDNQIHLQQARNVDLFIKNSVGDVNMKINYIISNLCNFKDNGKEMTANFYALSLAIAVIFGAIVTIIARSSKRKSYLVLTDEAKKNRDRSEKKRKMKFLWFFLSLVLGLSVEVASHYIYEWMSHK